jgi:hypothetical protein
VQGILADHNIIGQVTYLVQLMQAEPWAEFWQHLGLALRGFEDVGLTATAMTIPPGSIPGALV